MVYGEADDDAPNEELHVTNYALVWCSLDSVDVNLTILLDIVLSKEGTEVRKHMLDEKTQHNEVRGANLDDCTKGSMLIKFLFIMIVENQYGA